MVLHNFIICITFTWPGKLPACPYHLSHSLPFTYLGFVISLISHNKPVGPPTYPSYLVLLISFSLSAPPSVRDNLVNLVRV